MQASHGWASVPRTVVHDKAPYMANTKGDKLNANFAQALQAANLRSWAGQTVAWMAPHFGDVYPHETCIAHIRRLLEHKFVRDSPGETLRQFRNRMAKVEAELNSDSFAADGGGGLIALSAELRVIVQGTSNCTGITLGRSHALTSRPLQEHGRPRRCR